MIPPRLLFLCLALLAWGAGCRRPAVRTYLAPRDAEAPPATTAASRNTNATPIPVVPRPKVAYQAPPDWTPSEGGQVSVLNFTIKAAEGAASVNVTPLANFAGKEEMLINMWRQQVGAPPLSGDEAAKALSEVELAGVQGQIFEVTGTREGKANRIVTAMLHRPDGTWFFKLAGDDPVVNAQKPAFLAFLQSFRFAEAVTLDVPQPTAPAPSPAP